MSGTNGGSFILDNSGSSYFNALQVEVRRRLSHGLLVQGSYQWAKSAANGATNDNLYQTAAAYLELQNPVSALECFRRALRLNPDLEGVRVQVTRLTRIVEDSR